MAFRAGQIFRMAERSDIHPALKKVDFFISLLFTLANYYEFLLL